MTAAEAKSKFSLSRSPHQSSSEDDLFATVSPLSRRVDPFALERPVLSASIEFTRCCDVIIIGAGLSGLTAAYRLSQLRPQLSFLILEAKSRIGGRIYSAELPARDNKVDTWDLGGCWLGNKTIQPYINQLIADLEIEVFPQRFSGSKILQTAKNKITKYDKTIPSMGFLSICDVANLMRSLNQTQKNFAKESEDYDALPVEALIKRKAWTKASVECTRAAMRASFGTELCQISSLYLLAVSNSCGGVYNQLQSGAESAQGFKIKGGSKRICSKIVAKIGSEKILKRSVVASIVQEHRTVEEQTKTFLQVSTTSGNIYQCKNVVMAIPPHLMTSIRFEPCLSPIKYEYFSSIIPGNSIKIIITFEKDFWSSKGLSGEVVTYGGVSHTEGCSKGPLCIVFDATTHWESPALMALISGDQALQYEMKTKEERKEAVLLSLCELFETEEVRNFVVYCEKVWRQESYVGGCPTNFLPPGTAKSLSDQLRVPENNIHFAGSELGSVWMGLMEGAVESGERVALEVLERFMVPSE